MFKQLRYYVRKNGYFSQDFQEIILKRWIQWLVDNVVHKALPVDVCDTFGLPDEDFFNDPAINDLLNS